ncbi:hypothetical protein [Rossellomorea marisflavi]|uniref:hypothetical protein n=1 Tax=Rossellomorea marisflavi TaxID=189381 RepID=UPI003F9FC84D
MERMFLNNVEAGDVVFISEVHTPGTGFAPALPGGCYVCISAFPDMITVRTFGLVDGLTVPGSDFIPSESIERVVSMSPSVIGTVDLG